MNDELFLSKVANGGVLLKQVFLKISHISQENTFESPTQVFSCEICKIYKDTYFENIWTTASVL